MSTASGDPLSLSFDILRRLPPSDVRVNVDRLMQVLPEYADDIASGVDQPLTVGVDPSPVGARREFLCCDYNRDGGSWRSWISNTWCPPLESTDEARVVPTGKLRELELHANEAFETYRKLYVLRLTAGIMKQGMRAPIFGMWVSMRLATSLRTLPGWCCLRKVGRPADQTWTVRANRTRTGRLGPGTRCM